MPMGREGGGVWGEGRGRAGGVARGDAHRDAREGEEVLGEPLDRLAVEVVGRLVQQQQLGLVPTLGRAAVNSVSSHLQL